jgi:predicted nuclease of restriction endonuclease-like (RecB) superfamily
MTHIENWGVRQLRERINSMLFQRTAISKKPKALIKQELKKNISNKVVTNTELVFKDPYLLDFLGLKDAYSEKDLESCILTSLQKFIIELGSDFAFVARQKRIIIDSEDFRIDLLFYHRGLKRLIAIDLKLGKFKASYKGQMELYLRWLEKHEVREGENAPIGLILCAEKSEEHIELLQLEKSNIKVAEYLTALPPKKLLEKKLHQAVITAQKQFNLKIK